MFKKHFYENALPSFKSKPHPYYNIPMSGHASSTELAAQFETKRAAQFCHIYTARAMRMCRSQRYLSRSRFGAAYDIADVIALSLFAFQTDIERLETLIDLLPEVTSHFRLISFAVTGLANNAPDPISVKPSDWDTDAEKVVTLAKRRAKELQEPIKGMQEDALYHSDITLTALEKA
ncbi:hypothetical protein IAR50_003525 [Cryptococcus sp. DSM 104548]